jgi:hypothetical protein
MARIPFDGGWSHRLPLGPYAVLDVVGLNYAEGRYALDRELFPRRVIVGSKTFPSKIGSLWPMVEANPNVIGDFTWTGWDYLGEVGIGATAYGEDPDAKQELEREFPWLTAWCRDVDITGHRRPVSYAGETELGRATLATAGDPRLRATADRTALRTDGTDLSYVAIELVDDAGRFVTCADRAVTVAVHGPGVLAGMCRADPPRPSSGSMPTPGRRSTVACSPWSARTVAARSPSPSAAMGSSRPRSRSR